MDPSSRKFKIQGRKAHRRIKRIHRVCFFFPVCSHFIFLVNVISKLQTFSLFLTFIPKFSLSALRFSVPLKSSPRTSLVVQWLRLRAPSAGGLGSIPGRGTRSHMLQLKILHASTKNRHSQINKINKKKKKRKCIESHQGNLISSHQGD